MILLFTCYTSLQNARNRPGQKKKKKTLDLLVFCRKGKAIKKLQLIPNTIMNTNVLECFDNNYTWRQNCFIYSWIGKHLVNCLR